MSLSINYAVKVRNLLAFSAGGMGPCGKQSEPRDLREFFNLFFSKFFCVSFLFFNWWFKVVRWRVFCCLNGLRVESGNQRDGGREGNCCHLLVIVNGVTKLKLLRHAACHLRRGNFKMQLPFFCCWLYSYFCCCCCCCCRQFLICLWLFILQSLAPFAGCNMLQSH